MADLTPELLDKLEEIAKAATPGPWSSSAAAPIDGWPDCIAIAATAGRQKIYASPGSTFPAADAKHIAAASPDVVLALVADARKLEKIRALAAEDGLTARFTLAKIKEVLNG